MIPDPLHPAVVHFPLALAVLTPGVALLAAIAVAWGRIPVRAWAGVVVLQALVAASAWFAVETGEHEEERVERVVAEQAIEAHEETAERFLLLVGLTLPIAVAGLLSGSAGAVARGATVAASLVVLATAAVTGSQGGELVYRHGASLAYIDQGEVASAPRREASRGDHDEDDDEDDDD